MRRSAAPASPAVPARTGAALEPTGRPGPPDWRRSGLAAITWVLAVAGILVALGIAAGSAHAQPAEPAPAAPLAVRTTGDGAPAIEVAPDGRLDLEVRDDGTYTVEVDPSERDTGEVTLRVGRA